MIKTMQFIFEKLLLHSLEFETRSDSTYDEARFIQGDSDTEKWLQNIETIDVLQYYPRKNCCIFKYEDDFYFAVNPLQEIEKYPDEYIPVDVNSGAGSYLIEILDLSIKGGLEDNYIYNNIAPLHNGLPDYSGHEYNDLINVFESFHTYRISKSILQETLKCERLLGALLSCNKNNLILQFSGELLDEFKCVFLYGPESFYYDNLLNTLLASKFSHSYLEIYRCIESLFQLTYVVELHEKTKPNCTVKEYLEDLEKQLVWRPVESNALARIFEKTPDYIYDLLLKLKSKKTGSPENIHSYIYKIRNNLVHQKMFHTHNIFDDKEWCILIHASIIISSYWFNEFNDYF